MLLFLFFSFSGCKTQPVDAELCPKIIMHAPEKIDLSDIEKQLICGDPSDSAYKAIPLYQAKYLLQGFLQSRGYSNPRFEYVGNMLHVHTQEKSYLKTIAVNAATGIDAKRFERQIQRRYKKEVITPKLLNEIEAKAKSDARNESYPCVKVTSIAEPDLEKVTLNLSDLKNFPFGNLTRETIEGVNDAALTRFTSFKSYEPFTESDLILTEKRYLREGIVQGTYFQEYCDLEKNIFSLHQNFITGPPRVLRFGFGASTELGPMIRASWANQRYGPMASLLEARLQTSFKNQLLKLRADQYLWEETPRRSLNSELAFERNDQDTFSESNITFRPHLQWTRDSISRFWRYSTGPTFIASNYKTESESDEKSFKAAAIEATVQSKTHSYEIFDIHPEAGELYQLNFDFRHPDLGFSDPLMKLDLAYLKLLWLGNLGKGSSIAGLRLNAATTWVRDVVPISSLPPSVKWYGGGSDDLRGFKLNSIPDNNGLGALSKFSAKLELRKTHLFLPAIEGFLFMDSAYFGDRPWSLESRFWYSPGFGIRWLSPIGLVQTYLARSLSNKSSANFERDDGTFFYIGIGGIF